MSNQHLTDHLTRGRGPFQPPTRAEVAALEAERDALKARVAELYDALRETRIDAAAYKTAALNWRSIAEGRPHPLPQGVTEAESA